MEYVRFKIGDTLIIIHVESNSSSERYKVIQTSGMTDRLFDLDTMIDYLESIIDHVDRAMYPDVWVFLDELTRRKYGFEE